MPEFENKTRSAENLNIMPLSHTIELPQDFRVNDFLSFHGRDSLPVAEQVSASTLQKGLVWEGRAACLTISFHGQHASAELHIDGEHAVDAQQSLEWKVRHMLGLTQQIEEFEHAYRSHPQLGPLILRQAGLRVPLSASPFEALTWAITGQQISLNAALSLRRKLIQAAGLRHSGGLCCYPDAARIASMSALDLRQAGFSQTKAQTLVTLSRLVLENQLPLDAWSATLPIGEICEQLLRIRGIGPWTINYALLRGFGWLDGSLHGDAAVRRRLQLLLSSSEKVTEDQAKAWLASFSPWRALVAAHLWAMHTPET